MMPFTTLVTKCSKHAYLHRFGCASSTACWSRVPPLKKSDRRYQLAKKVTKYVGPLDCYGMREARYVGAALPPLTKSDMREVCALSNIRYYTRAVCWSRSATPNKE